MKKATNSNDIETQLARKVILETLRLKQGDSVTVETWNGGLSLARRFVVEARKVGAHPILIFEDEDAYVESVRNAPRDEVGKMGKHEYQLLSSTDAYFFIPSEVLEGYTRRLTPEEVDQSTEYGDSWYEAAEKAGLRGARMSFGFAGKELARMLGKKAEEIRLHQMKATLVDFGALRRTAEGLETRIPDGGKAVLSAGGSQLSFEFGEGAAIEDGIVDEDDVTAGRNMAYLPPGRLTRNIRADSVTGRMKFGPTLTWKGMVEGAALEFESGRLVGWNTSGDRTSKERLEASMNSQPDSERKIDAVTIGLNPVLRYGYGQDRFVAGSLGIVGLDFAGVVRNGTLKIDDTVVVEKGRLSPSEKA
jgi:leucyl aminopeptidase (aminopeptidase T)